MLDRIDSGFANVMLGTYLGLSAACIVILNMHEARKRRIGKEHTLAKWLPLILQFCFGSLFSAYIIFYTDSASIALNWPFLLFLVLLVISNELFKKRYLSPAFQLPIFFIVLFSWSVFSLPIVIGKMGGGIFILSGLLSLAIISLMIFLIRLVAPKVFAESALPAIAGILLIYAMFNVAYWYNFIPPVPLSLREIGIYHSVSKTIDGNYSLVYEPNRWYPLVNGPSSVFNSQGPAEPIYIFSSIFAPTKLTVPVFYTWSYYDPTDKVWVMTDRLTFPLKGGREEGYRGYTLKSSIFPARWRVDVETDRGERIGRVSFEVVDTSEPVKNLVTEVR